MEFDPIHKEEAMEMKISIDQSKSDPCLDLLLSSSDQSSSSSSDSSLFSSLTSSPSHHGSFHGSSSLTKTDEPQLSHCLLETISTAAPTHISALSQEHEGIMLGGPSMKAMVWAGGRIFSAHGGEPRIRVWMKTNKISREDEGRRRKKKGSEEPFILEHKQIGSMPRRKDCFIKGLSQRNYVQVRRHEKKLWIEHSDTISCLALGSIDSSQVLYSGSWDKTIKVWRLKDLKCLEGFRAHHDAVQAMVTSRDGFLYTSSSDGTIKVWTLEKDNEGDGSHLSSSSWLSKKKKKKKKKKKHVCIVTLCGGHAASASVNSLALSNDGELLFSGGSDGVICIWGKGEGRDYIGELRESTRAHRLPVLCLCIVGSTIHGEVLLSGSADKTVRIWKVDATHIDGIDGHVTHVSKSSISKLNICGANNGDTSTCHYHDNDALVTILDTTSKSNDDDTPLDSMPKSHRVGYSHVDACTMKSCVNSAPPRTSLVQGKLQERSASCGNGVSSPDLHHNRKRGLFVHTGAHLRRIGMLEGHDGPVKSISVSSNQHTQRQILGMDSTCIIYTRSLDETIKVWSLSHCNHNVLFGA